MTRTTSSANAKPERTREMTGSQNRNSDPASHGGWHLDKRVPVAIIVTLIFQTFGIIWWAATTQAQTNTNSLDIVQLKAVTSTLDAKMQDQRDGQVEVTTQVKMMSSTIDRQTTILDRLSNQVAQIPGVKN